MQETKIKNKRKTKTRKKKVQIPEVMEFTIPQVPEIVEEVVAVEPVVEIAVEAAPVVKTKEKIVKPTTPSITPLPKNMRLVNDRRMQQRQIDRRYR